MNHKFRNWLFEATEPKSKNLYFLIGPPAVGKSTWIKKNFADKEHKVISRDDIIEKLIYKEYGLTAAELYAKDKDEKATKALAKVDHIFSHVVASVLDSRPDNVIVDMMNATKKMREPILSVAKNRYPEYKLIAVIFEFAGHEDKVLQADIQRAKERGGERVAIDPKYIIDKMNAIKSAPPTTAEGFDEIQSYNRFKEPEQMKEYNHKQFKDWLNQEIENSEEQSNLLVEAALSKYWKARAARRAKNAERSWPNKIDRDWALSQQDKSSKMNDTIHNLFQKELDESEEMLGEIDDMMRDIKKKRKAIKMKREAKKVTLDHPAKATAKRKNGKNLSVPTRPEYGGVAKGYRKKSKKMGGATLAPGESFGPGVGALQEQAAPLQFATFGDLKKAINTLINKERLKAAGDQATNLVVDQLLGLVPGAQNVKSAFDFFKNIYSATDDKKTNTFLDKLNVDDKYAEIIDDKVEMAFMKEISNVLSNKPDNERIPQDFDINNELKTYLSRKYNKRTLTKT